MAIDPVCGMRVAEDQAAARATMRKTQKNRSGPSSTTPSPSRWRALHYLIPHLRRRHGPLSLSVIVSSALLKRQRLAPG